MNQQPTQTHLAVARGLGWPTVSVTLPDGEPVHLRGVRAPVGWPAVAVEHAVRAAVAESVGRHGGRRIAHESPRAEPIAPRPRHGGGPSRETGADIDAGAGGTTDSVVSRETGSVEDGMGAVGISGDSRETAVAVGVAVGTVAVDVSRETSPLDEPESHPAPPRRTPILTASDLAARPAPVMSDAETPIAAAADIAMRVDGRQREAHLPRPPATRVLVVANQKGGVGKTTSAVNIAAALALYGARVLLIDLDPQGNASTALGVEHHEGVPSMYDVLVRGTAITAVRQPADGVANLWCAPATIDLSGAEVELVSFVAREGRLKRAIEEHLAEPAYAGDSRYDYLFIDCPPSLGLLTVNALAAGAEVFLPIQCEYYALEGVTQLLRVIELIRSQLNPSLEVSTVLLTMYDGRTRLAAQVAAEVRNHFADVVLKTSIPRSVRVSEAPSYSQTVMTYDPGSTGALSYLEAARELANRPSPGTSVHDHDPREHLA